MSTIKGQSEVSYLLGAIAIVDRELSVAARRNDLARMIDASERLDSLKDCLVRALREGGAL